MAKVMSFLFCVVITTSVHFVAASPPPVASSDCSTVIEGVTDCLQYVGVGENAPVPDQNGQCCTTFKSAVRADEVMCLCAATNQAIIEDNFNFNMTRLSGLTLACHAPNGFDPPNCALPPPGVAPMSSPSPPSSSNAPTAQPPSSVSYKWFLLK